MDSPYQEMILDHYRNPRNKGRLDPADISHEDDNPLCGDRIRLDLRLDEDGRVAEVAWDGHGCAISMASASMLSKEMQGKTLEDLCQLGKDDILEMLGIELGRARLQCALLSLKVLKAAASGLTALTGGEER